MKRSYSYLIIKPDGIRFLDDLCNIIDKKYKSVRYYAIENYENIIKKLYYKHFERKGETFKESFQAYLYGLKELFGNYGILVLIGDKDLGYQELMPSVYETKIEIREKYANNNIGIVTNYGDGPKNYIKFIDEEGLECVPRIMSDIGTHRISNIDVIHCPDPNKEDTLGELNILAQSGIINDKNMITEEMLQQMRKYATAKFQEDMRTEGYEGGIQPDISGFIKSQIQQISDEEIIY